MTDTFIPNIGGIADLAPPFDISADFVEFYVYRGQDGNIDYDNPVAQMEAADSSVEIFNQDLPPNTIWHYTRKAISPCCGKLSKASDPCIVVIDADGNMVGATPNRPQFITLTRIVAGAFKLTWRYNRLDNEIEPTGFNIYIDSGSGFDFTTPTAQKKWHASRVVYNYQSDAFDHGSTVKFIVRSYRLNAGESNNADYVSDIADAQGPAAITGISASYQEIEV